MIAAVNNHNCICKPSFSENGTQKNYFFDAELLEDGPESESICTCLYHPTSSNPMCGGDAPIDHSHYANGTLLWSVFREYDFQSLSAQGAYDANRNIFFSVVGLHDDAHYHGGSDVFPERYFLFAAKTGTRLPAFEFQTELKTFGKQFSDSNEPDQNEPVILSGISLKKHLENKFNNFSVAYISPGGGCVGKRNSAR